MSDPFLAVRDILEAAVSLRVASHRMEEWLRKSNYPIAGADGLRGLAVDLDETARKLTAQIRAASAGAAPEP